MTSWFKWKVRDDGNFRYEKVIHFDEAGWKRVQRFYRGIFGGSESFEPQFFTSVFNASLMGGFMWGTLISARPLFFDLKERFNEMQFKGQHEFARRLTDYTALAATKNGLRFAWRTSLLASSYALISLTFICYRNDVWFSDIFLSSSLAGTVYHFYRGPKAMISGSLLTGICIGLPTALMCKTYLWLIGSSYEEFVRMRRDHHDNALKNRLKKQLEIQEKYLYKQSHRDKITKENKLEVRMMDHDVIVKNREKLQNTDDSFKKFTDPPDYVVTSQNNKK